MLKAGSVFILLLINAVACWSQSSPAGFAYQAVVRGADGRLKKSSPVSIVFTLRPSQAGAVVWKETQALLTDGYGVINTSVGNRPNEQSGGPAQFADIAFGASTYWMRATLGAAVLYDAALQSVPYARYASESNAVPAGMIMPFAGDSTQIPAGWALCNGALLDAGATDARTGKSYTTLYAAIGTAWGGTGASAFRLPDLRGQFLRGVANGQITDPDRTTRTSIYSGGNSGDKVGSIQAYQIQSHTHIQQSQGFSFSGGANAGAASSTGIHGLLTGPTGGSETRPTNAYVHYLIKL